MGSGKVLKTILVLFLIISVLIIGFFAYKSFVPTDDVSDTPKTDIKSEIPSDKLVIVSTNPDPLDNTIVLPNQIIEIHFNKVIPKSEFKYKLDPEIEGHEIEMVNGTGANGTTVKIIFKKPLSLGAGYTLSINKDTRTDDKIFLDKEYQYHFKTVQYKGV